MRKVICFTLAAMLFVSLALFTMASCAEDKKPDAASSGAEISSPGGESGGGESTSEELMYGKGLEVKNLGGRVINILCRDWGGGSIQGYNGEVIQRDNYDEKTADSVDVAKYEIRQMIEERYSCSIKGVLDASAAGDFNNRVRTSTMGGIEAFDVVFDAYGHANPLVTEGYYVDLFSIPTINFSNPWWDGNAVEDLSICKKLFFACGDINTYDNDGTWVLYFNKELLESSLPGENLYNLVYNNEWTFDAFAEIVKTVSADTDGNDGMSEFDTWGLGTETYNIYVHVLAAGERLCRKDSDGVPFFDYQKESMYSALENVLDLYLNDSKVMVANGGKYNHYPNVWEDTIIKAFREGRELFYMGGLINAVSYRQLEFNYGILPIPKYSSEQDTFFHSVSFHNMSCMLIPIGQSDEDYYDLGLVIEALGAESKNYLTPVYYDKALKAKNAETIDDENMLDIIFDSRCFDLGAAFNWGGLVYEFMKMDKNFIARFDTIADKAQGEMEDTIEMLQKNN